MESLFTGHLYLPKQMLGSFSLYLQPTTGLRGPVIAPVLETSVPYGKDLGPDCQNSVSITVPRTER